METHNKPIFSGIYHPDQYHIYNTRHKHKNSLTISDENKNQKLHEDVSLQLNSDFCPHVSQHTDCTPAAESPAPDPADQSA